MIVTIPKRPNTQAANRWGISRKDYEMNKSNQDYSEANAPIIRHGQTDQPNIEPSIENTAQREIDEHINILEKLII
jgi:hypothetical protein